MFGALAVGYLVLLLLFFLVFSISLYFGYREWQRPNDAVPLAMDVDYVRIENYLGRSFRAQVRGWLAEAPPDRVAAGESMAAERRAMLSGEHLLLLPGGRIGNEQGQGEIICSAGDLRLAEGATFRREIYCQARLRTESRVGLQSVAADGSVLLGRDNHVARWVDAYGTVTIRSGTVVGSRVSSLVSIELERGVSAQSLYAPRICTPSRLACLDARRTMESEDAASVVEGQPRAGGNGSDAEGKPKFLEGVRCILMAPGTWLVHADLNVPPGSRIADNLIVKGALTTGARCVLSRDVKATRLRLGERNHALGNLTAEGRLEVGEGSFVARNIVSESDVRLAAGVRVGRPESLAALSAAGEILLEPYVVVCGKLSAGQWIRTV